jgi:hypothetical protein
MSDQSNSLKDDITFMRQMAEQGRNGPVLGGAFLAAAGLIYGAASVVQWGIQTGRLPLPLTMITEVWIGASVLFAIVWVVMFQRLRKGGVVKAGVAQFAFGTVWAASGLGIVVTLGALSIMSARLHDPALMNANLFTTFAFYGVAWSVSAALARQRWMFAIAVAAFACALLLAVFLETPNEILVFGVGLIVTLFLPGLKLMHHASR